MIVDSSALVAVLFREARFEELRDKLREAESAGIGAPTLTETAIVVSARLGRDARAVVARLVDEAAITIIPYGDQHHAVAVTAWLRYGKGRHPAQLNFGDCIAYATAKVAGKPLLCVGRDFARTDLALA